MNTIAIVDDDPANVGLLKMLFELDGYTTVGCSTIAEAKMISQNVNAFVVDCHLAKGASGISLLEQIRMGETAVSPTTAVIMVSGDARLEQPSLAAGANAFLHKPYSPAELMQTINTLLKQ
jgi:CheY-like chemotaxis protein